MDARQEQTVVGTFEVLESVDYCFRNYIPRPGSFNCVADKQGATAEAAFVIASFVILPELLLENDPLKHFATDFTSRYENNTANEPETSSPLTATSPACY
ncbi:hypothetical protein [Undibacterium sp. Tian12W]|uniref:hypothetical protein n=1 Tax=Undibacterium sp. Tian12W TaxID=3413054 RepID=UPI003BEF604E